MGQKAYNYKMKWFINQPISKLAFQPCGPPLPSTLKWSSIRPFTTTAHDFITAKPFGHLIHHHHHPFIWHSPFASLIKFYHTNFIKSTHHIRPKINSRPYTLYWPIRPFHALSPAQTILPSHAPKCSIKPKTNQINSNSKLIQPI